MRYIPNSAEERAKMLAEMSINSAEDFFSGVPAQLRLKEPLKLPPPYAEADLIQFFKKVAAANVDPNRTISFLGAGASKQVDFAATSCRVQNLLCLKRQSF